MNTLLVKRIDNQIKALVSRAVFDVFNDPDFGLDLSARAKKRLSVASRNRKTISLSQIKKKYL
jgi:hypothetical protein